MIKTFLRPAVNNTNNSSFAVTVTRGKVPPKIQSKRMAMLH